MKKQSFLSVVVFALLSCLFNATANAQTTCSPTNTAPGSFDSCFGYDGTGTVLTTVPNVTRSLYAKKARLQSDGKILSLIDAPFEPIDGKDFNTLMIRYNTDGTLDPTFGTGGILYMNWQLNGASSSAYDTALQLVESTDQNGNPVTEERIVIVGTAPPLTGSEIHRLRVERYLSNGIIDTTFGADGTGRIIINTGYAEAVAVQPWDQKILIKSYSTILTRLSANGELDASFGSGGTTQTPSGISGRALAFQSNRKILFGGGFSTKGNGDFAIARLNENGSVDGTFGTSGRATTDFNKASDGINVLLVLNNDFIIAAGSTGSTSKGINTAVARFTPNGQLDTSSGAGKSFLSLGAGHDSAKSLGLQSDGKIVVFTEAESSLNGSRDFGVARFNANATVDTTFGQGGKVTWNYLGAHDDNRGVVQRNVCGTGCDRIVSVGVARTDPNGGYGMSLAAAVALRA